MTKNRDMKWLTAIHIALGLFLPVLVLLLTSCMEAEPEKASFGPESSASQVAAALDAPFGEVNPENILKGEFVHMETNQAIAGGKKFVTQDTGITVIDKVVNATTITYKLAIEEVTYESDGSSRTAISEQSVTVPKSSSSSLAQLAAKATAGTRSVGICEAVSDPNVTYHNLKAQNSSMNAPQQVQNGTFCAGQSPCKLATDQIAFDQVVWDGDKGTKIHCEFVYSTEVPFLAVQMKQCTTMAIPVDERSVVVTECSEVLNFASGN